MKTIRRYCIDNASVIPKHWADKLDHKTAYALESSILAYCDILDHDLFFFPEYTNHKMMHIRNILKISARLIPPESDADFTAGDIAVYILSVLYHDIGMHITYAGFLRILTENLFAHDYSEVYNDRPWPKLWEDYVREARLWNDKIRKQILGTVDCFSALHTLCAPNELPADSALLNLYDRLFIGEFLRRNHCRMAFDIACTGFPCADDSIQVLPTQYSLLVGHIARSHGEDIWKMLDTMEAQYGSSFLKIRDVHVLYLMVLLRIADYFDISDDRAAVSISRLYHFKSPVSVREWQKNQCVVNIAFGASRDPELLFIETIPPSTSSIFLSLKLLLDDMQRELDTSWAVLGDVYGRSPEKLHLSIRRIKSDLTNTECAEHRVNYLTERIAFRANPELLKLLIGPLYDYQPVYGIRELLQNSIDACHEKQALCRTKGESYHSRVVVEFISRPDGHATIRVSDNGIGMTGDVIRNYYMVAGSSYRYDPAWKKDYLDPDTLVPKVVRSGRFGIGVLSTFLLGDNIHVETVSYLEQMKYSFDALLESDQLDIFRQSGSGMESGTVITVNTSQKMLNQLRTVPDWFCENEPEIVFIPESRLNRCEYHPITKAWKTCVLSTGNTAYYRFHTEHPEIPSNIYVNGLLTETNNAGVSVNIREHSEEISLSLKRDRITGINARPITAADIQEEIIQSVLLARLLTCDPFDLPYKVLTHPYLDGMQDKILFTPDGYIPMGLINTKKPAHLFFTVSPGITSSERSIRSFFSRTKLSLDDAFFTDSSYMGKPWSGPQIKMNIPLEDSQFCLIGYVIAEGYFGAGYPDKSAISNLIGLDFSDYFCSHRGEHNEVLYIHKNHVRENVGLIDDLKSLWLEKAGWPLAVYSLQKGGTNRQSIWNAEFISELLGDADRTIPYSPEDRIKKFPKAYKALELYINNLN